MKIIFIILIVATTKYNSCCPPATEKNVKKWERKHKFRSSWRIERIKEKDGVYVVKFRKKVALQPTYKKEKYECLPDSFSKGKEVVF
jgi:hypothetical protein